MNQENILVVDDDKEIANALKLLLASEGYMVHVAHNGIQALDIIRGNQIHLILMDIMMPEMDGLSATIKIREEKNIPIIMLSAKSENSDKILGLSMGADDYVTKPYNPQELVARVKSHLRRFLTLGNLKSATSGSKLSIGGLSLDIEGKQLSVDGVEVRLTAKEYGIIELMMMNPGKVFSAEDIYEKVWNDISYSVENTVMVHIRRIREKIEINPKEPKYLKVVWGIGYKMEKI